MDCFMCIVEYQANERKFSEVKVALTVYHGNAQCFEHLNTVRKIPADLLRYADTEEDAPTLELAGEYVRGDWLQHDKPHETKEKKGVKQ